jgi:hypothetical protein
LKQDGTRRHGKKEKEKGREYCKKLDLTLRVQPEILKPRFDCFNFMVFEASNDDVFIFMNRVGVLGCFRASQRREERGERRGERGGRAGRVRE